MRRLLLVLALAASSLGVSHPGQAATAQAEVNVSKTALTGYRIQSSSRTGDTGQTISQPGYAATGWTPAGPRSTVMAALLANGVYPDPFFSTNMRNIPTSEFTVPWWYRSEFTLADEPGARTFLDFSGVISRADVFVNGTQIATSSQVAGAYTHHELDITSLARVGTNAVAFRIFPNNASTDLTIGWIDWTQLPPDRNMGIFRDVLVKRNGSVSLRGAHTLVSLNGALTSATLTAKVDVRNHTASAVTATVSGQVAGIPLSTSVSLAANEKRTVAFPAVTLNNPNVWWPAGMGGQPLYDLDLTATAGGATTDTAHERFGVRSVTGTLDASGHREYRINGKRILIKGGGWSPDLFLRWDERYVEDKIRYTLDLGLNTIRLEGHLEPDEFFDITDRLGVLALPGWECCNKWEASGWTTADFAIAKASMSAEAQRLRSHPSVISFLIGSDIAPPASKETPYLQALQAADWPNPIIPVASDNSSPTLGSSGMKMPGPYDWVPPNYWFNKREGGAFGFNSETSAGPDVPTLDTLRRMMTTTELNTLWQNLTAVQYHRSPSSTFDDLTIFNNAMVGRYGSPASLEDYVRKAQLAQYENVRAQFEAYSRNFTDSSNPSTGVIYWMLNSGWTSLHWQLFDRYMDQNGAYYGSKKANEPLHIQYGYDSKAIHIVNSRPNPASGLTARVSVYNTDGTQVYTNTVSGLSVTTRTTVQTLPAITGLSTTHLLKLTLSDSTGAEVSRNVYWLSTAADVINWAGNTWYYVPTSSYANLKGLTSLAAATLNATASTVANVDGTSTVTVNLRNDGSRLAFYTDLHVVRSNAVPVLPIQWSDNAVSLWPGEAMTLTATFRTADLGGSAPSVRISGWNTAGFTIPAGPSEPDVTPPTKPGVARTTSVSSSSVGLTWDPSTDNIGVVGYDVFRDGTKVGTTPTPGFTDTGLTPATTYVYTVQAKDPSGNLSVLSDGLTVTTPSGPARYEAENAFISQGLVESNHAGFSGTGFVNYDNVTGSYVEWTVNAPTAGNATIAVGFANGTTTDRPMSFTVNGTGAQTVSFPGTGAWTNWQTRTLTVSLVAGENKIRATATTANGGPNTDYIDVSMQAPPPPVLKLEAEDAFISDGAVESNHAGFSGTGFVNCTNVAGSYVEWTFVKDIPGTFTLKIRYANGTTANRPAEVRVNGVVIAANQAFNPTGAWSTWADVTLTVNLNSGSNTIRVTGTTATGPANLDYISIQ